MKNIVFPRILKILIVTLIFIGCSKEELSVSNSGEAKGGGIMYPVHFGGVSGKLSPTPSYAALKLFNDEQHSVTEGTVDGNGSFRVMDLFPGTYRMLIVYILPGTGGQYRNYEIQGILVQSDMVTNLGEIILPQE